MDLEYFDTAVYVGVVDRYLTVKTSGTEKCRVENVGAVGCRNNDYSVVRAKSVHLNEKLVERLLALVMSAAESCASVTAYCVYLVDKND